MTNNNIKILREIYKAMQRNIIKQHDNGARMTGERGIVDLVLPAGTPTPRELVGYIQVGDGSILLDDVEMDPVTADTRALAAMSGVKPTALFVDGNDAIFAGAGFAYSVPMKIPLVREHGKGHNMMLEPETAQILGFMAQLGEVQFSMAAGTMDGENLLIDVVAMTREDGTFKARIETPIMFGPWTDFGELIRTLMGGTSVIVQPRIRSLKATLKKAADAVTPPRGDRSVAHAELILGDGEMKIRPLERIDSENNVYEYNDHREPLPVKVDGFSGSSGEHYQFFPPMLMHSALEMFDDGEAVTMSVGALIGEPIVLWKDDVRFAIRTGKRV